MILTKDNREIFLQTVKIGDVKIQGVPGKKTTIDGKSNQDIVFKIKTPGDEYVAWTNEAQVYMSGAILQNEDVLYPTKLGYAGGDLLLELIELARYDMTKARKLARLNRRG